MKFFNRFKCSVLAAALCLTAVLSVPSLAAEDAMAASEERYNMEIQSNSWENWPTGPQIYAESAIIMEASTGTVLYAKNIDEQNYPASITKIMTVLLALEHLELDEEVTFSRNAVFSIPYASSHIARDEGEILTVEECLYAIMLESANECSNAIAEKISGTTEAFADLMNEKAAELGCTNTHFANPHGLPDENHYTSAHDMALIAREAIKYEKFRQISGTSRYTLRATNKKDEELPMSNHHYMLSSNRTSQYLDDTVFAGKTGYTEAALNTLVTCATRGGMDLIVVTMKTQGTGQVGVPVYTDTANLLNYAGENFQKVNISQNETNFTIGQNELFDTGSSVFGSSVPMIEMDTEGYIILPVNAEFSDASPKLEFSDADTEADNVIATLSYTYAGQEVGYTNLKLSDTDIQAFDFHSPEENEALSSSKDGGERLIKINLRVVGIIIAGLLLILVILLFIRRIAKDYSVDLNPLRRWRKRADRNSFSSLNRRRYRSRKRNKINKGLKF